MISSDEGDQFVAARDLLLRLRDDHDDAVARLRWPHLNKFNWALDYFDQMAQGNTATALWIVNADGNEHRFQL